ncbi:MAG: menaquinone biosynthesis decarboxylase [Verrucomicrobia bacterium]|nr:MAG: menaquinone biosynthesis decarboxylase [Verrucomicrobiota bacterium]PYL30267.1 MAG: menaquinone biosynthesis decarboxylase [Verrucomicrobiota bacterium]
MAYRSFRHFLETLEQAGELTRVSDPVDTNLLITEWADREMKSSGGGKALLFEQPVVDGQVSKFPVAINTMGSRKRIAMALGRESIDEIAQEIQLILKAKPPTDLREGFALLKQGIHLLHARPKQVRDAPCQEIIHKIESDAGRADDFSLRHLPILKCWPKDGGRFITLPNVHTRDPETGARNVGVYRMQIFDERTTAMHWQVHKVGARHGKRYYQRNEPMPVAVALGGDPALSFSATAPLPDGLDEILFAGFLRRKSIEMVKCKTIDLEVPAGVDLVLEGYVQPGEMRPEGPFGDHTGYYTAVEDYPVFHLTAITHRRDAVYPTTIVGIPPMEDFYIGDAVVRIFLPVFKMNFPELVDMTLPAEGVFHNLVIVSIRKQYPYQAFKVMHGLWGMGQMMFSKYIVVVDEDCDVHNTSEVLFRLCANTDPGRDTTVIKNPSDSLDHAPTEQNIGSHMGFDATRKLPGENYHRQWPELLKMTDEAKALVDALQKKTR